MSPSKQSLPYGSSKLTPSQSREKITDLLTKSGCRNLSWTMIDGEYNLRFAYPLKKKEIDPNDLRMIGYLFRPPRIPKRIREYDKNLFRYEWTTINDEKSAFRVLYWYLKNKLIAIETGLVSIEEEFMSHIVLKLPNGQEQTLGERLSTQIPQLTEIQTADLIPSSDEKKREIEWRKPSGELKHESETQERDQ